MLTYSLSLRVLCRVVELQQELSTTDPSIPSPRTTIMSATLTRDMREHLSVAAGMQRYRLLTASEGVSRLEVSMCLVPEPPSNNLTKMITRILVERELVFGHHRTADNGTQSDAASIVWTRLAGQVESSSTIGAQAKMNAINTSMLGAARAGKPPAWTSCAERFKGKTEAITGQLKGDLFKTSIIKGCGSGGLFMIVATGTIACGSNIMCHTTARCLLSFGSTV